MIEKIEKDLKQLQIRQKEQNSQIDTLYLALSEIHERKERLQTGFTPRINLFNIVRPEVMYQILEFADIKSFFKFRQVSRRCNEIIKQTSPQKILQISQQMQSLEADKEKIIQEYKTSAENEAELNQQLQAAQQGLDQLQKAHINELKSLACPPDVVNRVCQYLLILLNPQFNETQYQWKDGQKMLNQMDLLMRLKTIEINTITDKQLAKLVSVDQLTLQQVQACSLAASGLFSFIKALVDLRRSKLYILKYQVETLKTQLNQKKSLIDLLEKISNK